MSPEEYAAMQLRKQGMLQNFGGQTPIHNGFEIRTNLLNPALSGFKGVSADSATGNLERMGQDVSTNSFDVTITNTFTTTKYFALFAAGLPKELVYRNREAKGVDAIAAEGKFLVDAGDPTKYLELQGKSNFDKYIATLNSGYVQVIDKLRIEPSVMSALNVTYHIQYNRLLDTDENMSFKPARFVDKNQNQDLAEIPLAIGSDSVCFSPMTTFAIEIAPMTTVSIAWFTSITHSNLDATLALARAIPKPAR